MDFSSPKASRPTLELSPMPFSRLASLPSARYSDRETAPLILGQNAPNPHDGETYIPFTLLYAADVRLEIFDLLGRKMAAVVRKSLGSGEHRIQLNLRGLCLPLGEYPYVLQATSAYGLHSLSRIMTLTGTTSE
jgi:hypothetical protein